MTVVNKKIFFLISQYKYLLGIVIALTIFRFWLGRAVGFGILIDAYYDDALMIRYANMTEHFITQNLGYNDLLLKDMGFPLFLKFVQYSGLAYTDVLTLLWIFAAIAFVSFFVMLTGMKQQTLLLAVYSYVLFFPMAFTYAGVRLYRNAPLMPLYFIVITMMAILFVLYWGKIKARFRNLLLFNFFLGLLFTLVFYFKEDGIWLLLCLIAISILCFAKVILDKFDFKLKLKHFAVLVMPFIIFSAVTVAYKQINQNYFGVYLINNRTEGELGRFVKLIYKIKSDERDGKHWAPTDALLQAFAASETLNKSESLKDTILHTFWFEGDIVKNPIHGDFLTWVMHSALKDSGQCNSFFEQEEYLKKVNDELDKAFDNGILQKDDKFQIVSSMGGRNLKEIFDLRKIIGKIYRSFVIFAWDNEPFALEKKIYLEKGFEIDQEKMDLYRELNLQVSAITNTDVFELNPDYTTANVIVEFLLIVYSAVNSVLFILAFGGIILFLIKLFKKELSYSEVLVFTVTFSEFVLSFVLCLSIAWFVDFLFSSATISNEFGIHPLLTATFFPSAATFYGIGIPPFLAAFEICGSCLFYKIFVQSESTLPIMNFIERIFVKRWTIGAFFILIFTALEIHGSSISIYADILAHPELSDIILGKYRPIRSDEWIVFTPFAFSQYFTNFSFVSDIVRAELTNMFMTYGQAVWHPAIIFRPAQIGYLFFDAGSGLAFFWMSRLVILFLVSFEFARLILQVSKKLSVIYAIMIAFSPLAQWWWSVNSIAEILAAGQGVVICWKLYLENFESQKRFLFVAGFLFCSGVFIFGIYPAWQVTFGYVFLLCLIAISFNQKNALQSLWRDKIFWLAGSVIVLAPIIQAVYISRDMIELQMATEYPGRRFTLGGNLPINFLPFILFGYGLDILLPFKDITNSFLNNCEAATFFSMAPLGWLIFFYLRFYQKQKDLLMTLLFCLTIFFTVWEFIELPAFLAKFSFLSMTTSGRLQSALDFAQLLIVFRGLTLIKNFPNIFSRFFISVVITISSMMSIHNFIPECFGVKSGFVTFAFITLSIFLFLSPMNKKNFAVLAVLMLGIGATVNPINKGVDVIYKMPAGQKISEIVQQETSAGQKKSLWLVVNGGVGLNNFPIMFGAPTINSTNVYPVLERWKKIDTEGNNFKIYNRYAHIDVELQNNLSTEFVLKSPDNFSLQLNPADLKTLEVKYIFSRNGELEKFSTPQIKIQKIFEDAGSFVYEVN